MNSNLLMRPLAAMLLFSCCLAMTARNATAGDKVDAKDKIKQLQKKRLEAATIARDNIVKRWRAGSRGSSDVETAVWTPGFQTQMLDAHKLVFQARFELCNTKAERIKAIEDTIKEFEPILAKLEQYDKEGIVDSTPPFRLAQAFSFELQIALQKAKQEGAP